MAYIIGMTLMKGKKMKQNEIGRTMVEMLGVLAIVGILSMTGIKGFMMAMDKLSANSIAEVIGAASMYAQTNNLDIEDWNDLAEDYEGDRPACVEDIKADKKSG